jgi:hypothetical protein
LAILARDTGLDFVSRKGAKGAKQYSPEFTRDFLGDLGERHRPRVLPHAKIAKDAKKNSPEFTEPFLVSVWGGPE